jgi:phytoene desaturase
MKAVVIGTGLESLASALHLRALGHDVDVLEAGSEPGGGAYSLRVHGHSVAAAPCSISEPWLFDGLFALFKERRPDFVEFIPSNPYRRNLYPDGTHLDIVSSIEQQEDEIARISPEDATRYRAFLKHCEQLYETERADVHAGCRMTTRDILRNLSMPQVSLSSLWRLTGRYFVDRRVRQAFSWHSLSLGESPLIASARYAAVHAVERREGVWSVRGGMPALMKELVALGMRHGVRFYYDHQVVSFSQDGAGRVSSIYSAHQGERVVIRCDLVISGGDSRTLSHVLRDDQWSSLERAYLRSTAPSVGMYWLFLKTKRSHLEVPDTTIIHAQRWEGLLSQICKGTRLPKDPTFAVHRVPSLANGGARDEGEMFSIFVPVPPLARYAGWKFDGLGFKDTIVTTLRETLMPGLSTQLVFSEAVDPRHMREILGGALGGADLDAQRVSPISHYRMRAISNLFLCGGGRQGILGISGSFMSASALAEVIGKEFPTNYPGERLDDIAARSVA